MGILFFLKEFNRTDTMYRIITFDICSVITLIVLLSSLFFRKVTKGNSNNIFMFLVIVVLLSGVFDIWRIYYPLFHTGTPPTQFALYVLNYLYFIFRNLSTPVYILFIFSVCGMWHEFNKDLLLKFTWGIPILVVFGLLIVDMFTHQIFSISPNLNYERGPWLSYLCICAIWLMAYSVICLIYNRHMLTKVKLFVLLSICPINILGILIQMYVPELMVEVLFTTFPLLLISLAVQKPEEIIDFDSGSLNFQAYKEELKRNFIARRQIRLISIRICDYEKIVLQLGKQNIKIFLSQVIKVLYSICDSDEYDVYYLGDGNFTILTLRNDEKENIIIAQKARRFFSSKHEINKINLLLDYKICYIHCPEELKDYASVMNFQRNMNQIIQENNNVVYLKEIADSKDFQIHHQIDHIISRGIINNSFEMYYQPIYSVEKRQFVSAEALIRLKDENLGYISPAVFIPAAENNGAIHQIGDFVLDSVVRFISESSLEIYGIDYIEINLSLAQCIESDLQEKVLDILKKYSVSNDKINLEITETSENLNQEVIEKNIKGLTQKGISFSLDDYGTGYSNIWRITKLPFEIIKLDKSFVDDLNKPGMKIVISETISMLKKLNKKILIEGVETFEEFDYFRTVGCDYVQGYYFSKPLQKDDFIIFLKSFNLGQDEDGNAL